MEQACQKEVYMFLRTALLLFLVLLLSITMWIQVAWFATHSPLWAALLLDVIPGL